MNYLAAFAVLFITTGLKVVQQRNVEEGRIFVIPCLSLVMQFVECVTWGIGVHAYSDGHWGVILTMGLGAGSGSLTAMWVDRNWLRVPMLVPGERPKLRAVK